METKWNEVGQKLSSIDDNSQENILDSIMGEYKDTPEFAAILRQLRMGTGPTAYTIFKNDQYKMVSLIKIWGIAMGKIKRI